MQPNMRETEPGLYEVVQPLLSRWKLLLVGVFLAVLITAVVTSFLPKQYETSFVLTIGFAGDKLLEDAVTVTRIVNSQSFQQTAAQKIGLNATPRALQRMVRAETDENRWNTSWVGVSVMAEQPETAVQLANSIAGGIIERHKARYDASMKPIQEHNAELRSSIERVEAQVDVFIQRLQSNPTNQTTDLLIQTRINDNEHQLIALKKNLREAQLSSIQSRNTSVVSPPVPPQAPSKPNLSLNLVAAALGSIFLMISFILLFEQYRKSSLRF